MSVLVLVGLVLLGGGVAIWVKGRGTAQERRKQGLLMIIVALVMFANVLIWGMPMR